jgi:hypothetical protein
MRSIVISFLFAAALAAAEAPVSTRDTWRATDAQGTTWVYHQTPFGVARVEDKVQAKTAPEPLPIKATAAGDVIRFERPGPFGIYKWQRARKDLDPVERAACEQAGVCAAAQE